MLKTYKILSLLLDYPEQDLLNALPFVQEELKSESILDKAQLQKIQDFADACVSFPLSEWQMLYVNQFDCGKQLNLYLFDHIYGDSRERGQAMVDLKEMYEKAGFEVVQNELPDYLPLFLEFLSYQKNAEKASKLLNDIRPVLENIHKQLAERNNFYDFLFVILLDLAESQDTKKDIKVEPAKVKPYGLFK